jgi:membrane dipeptidase
MTAKSHAILPTAGSPDYRNPSAANSHAQQPPHRPNLKKLALGASLALATIGLLYKPAFSHYQRISQHSCSKTLTVEERAHKILSTTPLIGKLMNIALPLAEAGS